MVRKLVAVDLQAMEISSRQNGLPFFPLDKIKMLLQREGVDVIEMLVTLPQYLPESDDPVDVAKCHERHNIKMQHLRLAGGKVIECPSKKSMATTSGYKHSDDQRLMLTTMMTAMKLRPDYVVLFAADGDFAPLVEMLRNEGIRTEVVAAPAMMAFDLKLYADQVTNFDDVCKSILAEWPELGTYIPTQNAKIIYSPNTDQTTKGVNNAE